MNKEQYQEIYDNTIRLAVNAGNEATSLESRVKELNKEIISLRDFSESLLQVAAEIRKQSEALCE